MDWNAKTTSEWGWEKLTRLDEKTLEIPKVEQPSKDKDEGYGGGGFSFSDLGCGSLWKNTVSASADSSSTEGLKAWQAAEVFENSELMKKDIAGTLPSICASSCSREPIIGLKLGNPAYLEDICAKSGGASKFSVISSTSAATGKRSRLPCQNTQNSCCQVEGCNLDLRSAKDYHRRHRICENHSKSPKVIVGGLERRFCQQCSRFHELSEFDEKKRSCRRRLSDHNARRRRPQSDGVMFNSTRMTSTFYDGKLHMNAVSNRDAFPTANPVYPDSFGFKVTQGRDSLSNPEKAKKHLNLYNSETSDMTSILEMDSSKMLSFERNTSRVFSQGLVMSTFASNLQVAPDLRRAHSLLSTTWGLDEPGPSSLDQLVHVNQSSISQTALHTEHPSSQLASSDNQQDFQLLKTTYESDCFFSNHMD